MFFGQWWPVLIAPVIAALLAAGLLGPARRFGCIDHPGGRKSHDSPTPLVGGIAIFLSFTAVSGLKGGIPGGSWSLLAAMLVALVFGLADDMRQFGYRTKFFGQLIAALIVVSGTSAHVMVFGDLIGAGYLELGKWSYLVTVISLIGLMNAVNMIDGLDGLAGTVVAIPLAIFGLVALLAGEVAMGMEILSLTGVVCGFLALNLRLPWQPRARAFMGDVGGLLLGLLLGWYAIKLAGTYHAAIRPITAVWILALPLLDMGGVMSLRILSGKSPFHADRRHLHHLLCDAGLSVSQIVAIMALASLVFGIAGLRADHAGIPEYVMFYAFLILLGLYVFVLSRAAPISRAIQAFSRR